MTAPLTGYLVVRDGLCAGQHFGWNGEWPPPEELVAVAGRVTEPTVTERDKIEGNYDDLVRLGFKIEVLKQVRASFISDEAIIEMTHVARGAEYVRDREWP